MGNRSKRKRIASLHQVIEAHQQKIARERSSGSPREWLIQYWQKEIKTFEQEIVRAERQLTKHRRKRRSD